MKFAFLIPRANHVKIIGPVWDEAKRRGHQVEAIVTPADVKGAGVMAHVQAELGGPIQSPLGLSETRFDWAVAVGLRTALDLRLRTRPRLKWAALDSTGDNLTYLLEGDPIDGWDFISLLSVEASAFAGQLGAKTEGLLCHGYPELDQLSTVIGDRAACRAKWNLPGQKMVLFGPAARPIRLGRVRRWWFQQLRYRHVLWVLRRWAEMAGFVIIAKTRAKHRDPGYLRRYCDRIVVDESFDPFTTLELLRAADLYVGFASAMAIEACAVGIPQVHLHGWPPEEAEWPSAAPFKQRFFIEKGGLWNVAGSRSVTCYGEDWPMRLHETLDDTLAEFSLTGPGAMRRACERWAGPLDGASARFLDALESRR